ncbi:MAG: helix-turn-helix domain-containing protein [Clostridia bacterium]|nr:helix-turn-helix domain-containing protein [Clostridia bacterium]
MHMNETILLTADNIRPFVRCVGLGEHICQQEAHKAYDHRMICVMKGQGILEIEDDRIETAPHTFYMIPPGTSYRVCSSREQQVLVVNFDLTDRAAQLAGTVVSVRAVEFDEEKIIERTDWSRLFGDRRYVEHHYGMETADALQKLLRLYFSHEMSEEIRRLCLMSTLLYILTDAMHTEDRQSRSRAVAEKIHTYILTHYESHLTMEDAAAEFHYSPSYISRILRLHYHASFKQILTECRLSNSLLLLENTDLSCEEIAQRVGFYNGQHFSGAFERMYGKKPTQFRRG